MDEQNKSLVPHSLFVEAQEVNERRQDLLVQHASKGFTKDYTNIDPSVGPGRFMANSRKTPDLNTVLQLISQDPIALAAVHKLIDRSLENGWYVKGRDKKSRDKKAIETLEDLRFDAVLEKVLFHIIMYGNAFIEIVKNGTGTITELNVLEPTLMRIEADNVGTVSLYWQQVLPGVRKPDFPAWQPEDVIHLKSSHLTTSVWGDVDLLALEDTLATKISMKKFIRWLFETNQFKKVFTFGEAVGDTHIEEFLAYYRATSEDAKKPLVIRGEVDLKALYDFKDAASYSAWLQKMDDDTCALIGVPSLVIGLGGGSEGRSTGDSFSQTANTKVKSLQRGFAEMVTYDLLPVVGFDKVKLKFLPPDKKNAADVINMAEILVNMKVKPEYIQKFMSDEGIELSEGDESIFYTPEELAQQAMAQKPQVMNTTGSMDKYPSRKGKPDGQSSQRIGTGNSATTRRDQLVQHADDKFAVQMQRWVIDVPE